ncbi:MAG TPA: hypothetical protein VFQ38_15380 [Longimicrobiales bacterium]|nr:hypothetical protein [Longimicrobiales bacterium]
MDDPRGRAWGGYERMVEEGRFTWGLPFWEQPRWRRDAMMCAGVRAAFVASQEAALAQEYGFTDVDGKRPRPLTLADV